MIPWTLAHQASLSFTVSQSLLRLMSMKPSNHLILCHLLLFLLSIFPNIRVFPIEPTLHIRLRKNRSMSFRIRFSNDYSLLISFRIDWFDFLAIQGTLKSLLQNQSLKASVLGCSAFFMIQLTHLYMVIGKTIALTRQTFVSKVMSLLFNILFRFVIAFPQRNKCLLISWLQSPSAVILEPKKIKSVTISTFFPIYCHEVRRSDTMIIVF